MKRDVKRRWLFSLLAPSLLVTGCAGIGDERACTTIGGESGVTLVWEPADFSDADSASGESTPGLNSFVARLCAQEVCESQTVAKGSNDSSRQVSKVVLEEDIGEVGVPVRFTVTSQNDGRSVLFDERTDVELRKSQPNGEACPPTLFRAELTAAPERGLTAADGG
ncbi:hypothetical protein ACWGJT_33240 [Streptomyces xantholiticus]